LTFIKAAGSKKYQKILQIKLSAKATSMYRWHAKNKADHLCLSIFAFLNIYRS
jgi:hypothetical protein